MILGRRPQNVWDGLRRAPEYLKGCVRCFKLFDRPMEVVWSYLMRRTPSSHAVRLKNGWTIHLSSDPADIVTIVVVFGRVDYGPIAPGDVVIDVGANIGVFALYAALCGARRVLAFEPSAESFAILQRNVLENGLGGVIVTHRLAVASAERQSVRFPRQSSVMNSIMRSGDDSECDEVPAVTLAAIVQPHEQVDLVKLDCEGAEYEILFGAAQDALRNVAALKLEYHQGLQHELIACMRRHGFGPSFLTADNAIGGVMWFSRRAAA